jgi:NADH-quinone oxidoreductase subunit J
MSLVEYILGTVLLMASLGVILAKRPVYAALSFLLALFALAAFYLQLSAHFIGAMQILVYAGAILVIFMFVIVLFQDAHEQLKAFKARSEPFLLWAAAAALITAFTYLGKHLLDIQSKAPLPSDFGTVEALGYDLYIDYFFPFEAVILLFLVAVIGAFYIGKKGERKDFPR